MIENKEFYSCSCSWYSDEKGCTMIGKCIIDEYRNMLAKHKATIEFLNEKYSIKKAKP